MLEKIKAWIISEKAQLNGVIQGHLPHEVVRELEKFIQIYNLSGTVRVIRQSYAEFILEGPKSRLETFLKDFPKCQAMRGKMVKIGWSEYSGKHHNFRVSWE